ncbi:hypothetical protein Q5752_003551 [Cryptotrichosporon argae]
MNDGQYAPDYDERDARERREPYAYAPSPPPTASPFAFAPPPLSAVPSSSRPQLAMHHSEPAQSYNYYAKAHGAPAYAYAGSHPMGYRSVSSETAPGAPGRSSPSRNPSFSSVAQASPSASPYAYTRSGPSPYAPIPGHSPQPRPAFYPAPYYPTYGQPGAVDMPRSLSYPSTYPTPYHVPGVGPPMGHDRGLPGQAPSLGYSFANRLPLVDRPFKCDECVQSFNRNHDLKRHKRIHLSVKPFGCDKCGKTFSRKDALRRHWLVKGCRGEDGATAPITPTFPLNGPPPTLSPPTPPSTISPTHPSFHAAAFSHPGAPPPLGTLPSRAQSDQSQLILTPDDLAQQQQHPHPHAHSHAHSHSGRSSMVGGTLDEPLVLETPMSLAGGGGARGSAGSLDEGSYFDGVVGIRKDGTVLMDPAQRYPVSPATATAVAPRPVARPAAPVRPDGKPVFAVPFPSAAGPGAGQQYLASAPVLGGEDMEKQSSAGSDPQSWQRWHRPSFPFPTPGNGFDVNINGAPAGQAYAA